VYADVCEALTHDAEVDATEVEVKVIEGEVTLVGTVTSREQKRRAGFIADRIAGVRDVHNQLRIEESARV
jgi:osmotically-inducible protein OsmY